MGTGVVKFYTKKSSIKNDSTLVPEILLKNHSVQQRLISVCRIRRWGKYCFIFFRSILFFQKNNY